jgi:thioredoxin-like negative regulator of GroEL
LPAKLERFDAAELSCAGRRVARRWLAAHFNFRGLTLTAHRHTVTFVPQASMNDYRSNLLRTSLSLTAALCIFSIPARCQDSGDQGTMVQGDRAQISVTVRNSSGEVVGAPVIVKLLKNGMPSDQVLTSHGRAFFIPRGFGEFTITVEATGYKAAQKDLSVTVAGKFEVDVYLQRELASNETAGVPPRPTLAPKAQEALTKGTHALREGKLDEAKKYLDKAVQLAPGNPDVLYVQGMLFMRQHNWEAAQPVLQKADQLDPNQPRVLAALGMTLCNQKNYAQAIPLLEKSRQLEPASGWETDLALGKAYYYQERYEEGLKMAESAHTSSHASITQVELLRAQCLTAVGRYGDSAEVLREVLKSHPNDPDTATAKRWLDGLLANGKIH